MTASGFGAADRVARAGDSMTGPLTMSAATVNYVEATPTSTAVNIQATGDTQQRLIVDASGTHTWGTGAAVGDVNLSRSAVGVLACNGIWQAATVQGGSGSAGTLTLTSTSNATKGKLLLGASSAYDELNTRLGIGTTTPAVAVDVVGQITASAIMQAPVQQGGVSASGNITIASTTHATRGKILFGTSAYDEFNNRLGIGNASPAFPLDVTGAANVTGNLAVGGTVNVTGVVASSAPAAAARSAGTQVIATATATTVFFDASNDYDTDGMHNTVTNSSRFVPPVAGRYVMTATIQFPASVAGTFRQISVIKNGVTATNYGFERKNPLTGTLATYISLTSVPIVMNGTTDFLEILAQHDVGANMTMSVCLASVYRVRA